MQNFYAFDTEATGPSTYADVATEFGFVHAATGSTFYGILWDSVPDPDVPARPVLAVKQQGARWSVSDGPFIYAHAAPTSREGRAEVFAALAEWRDSLGGAALFSDNPAFDWQFIAFGYGEAGLANPFGFSARRIGDLAAGLAGKPRDHNSWKRLRRTKHDHNPVNDSKGNVEALLAVLRKHEQAQSH